ncbi:hypothetical protein [Pseudomonas fluorescens]|uniref:hypothetical protein n=1 Tax=Pseudomonas fluorescens TaxID=294 RepID=UPI00177D9677|nr:hypothetical protein [Pseudomonas fluorescens]
MEKLMQAVAADLLCDKHLLVVPKSLVTHLIRLIEPLRQSTIVAVAADDGDRDKHIASPYPRRWPATRDPVLIYH